MTVERGTASKSPGCVTAIATVMTAVTRRIVKQEIPAGDLRRSLAE
jgi:hypothetical protein